MERYKVFAEYVNHMCNKVLGSNTLDPEKALVDFRDKYYLISPAPKADDVVKEMQTWISNQ